MLLDKENLFSDAQAITATAVSTNVVDLGTAKDHGPGEVLNLLVQVTENFATLTSLTVALQTDTVEGFGSVEVVAQTAAIAAAALKAGYEFKLAIPRQGLKRFLRLNYTVGGSNATAGKITAGVVPSLEQSFA